MRNLLYFLLKFPKSNEHENENEKFSFLLFVNVINFPNFPLSLSFPFSFCVTSRKEGNIVTDSSSIMEMNKFI